MLLILIKNNNIKLKVLLFAMIIIKSKSSFGVTIHYKLKTKKIR